jgi:glycogen phosphorylase
MISFKRYNIAYFSMEIGIDPDVPTFSGGLGVLAGDTLRSCANLSLPVIGITLIYRKGFFKQKIDFDGNQHEEEVHWDVDKHLTPLNKEIYVNIEGRKVKVSAWLYETNVTEGSKNAILFLDTDHKENSEFDRSITDKLYGYDQRYRLAQEIILGIGGIRMLNELGCTELKKFHMNEGHSALLTLELYKNNTTENKMFDLRDKCVFTTHTPVPAGHDVFPRELAESMIEPELLTEEIKGHIFSEQGLNMTLVGLEFSDYVNGVAKKHGEVSRFMFPGHRIDHITNGVHSEFWTSKHFKNVFDKHIAGWLNDPFTLRYVLSIPEEEIWEAHIEAKKDLIKYIKEKYGILMDHEIFTIGFARRAATYKRGDMLFSDIERLKRIANDCKGLQIIYAGKAHPNDWEGKQIIRRIIKNMEQVKDKIKVIYLEDYDINVAKLLIPGVDIWLNTPQTPKEASGTSGMKAAHNGVPHFSTLDGWWIEGHIEKVTGFSIGEHPNRRKEINYEEEKEDLYSKLEYVIIPRFYNERDKWINMMKHSIAINGSFFNTHRMVQQYVLNAYFK